MEKKTLQNGFSLPVLGLGTWLMGGALEADYSDDKKQVEAIKTAIKLGYTHIDTAEMYGQGHSEELIGEAIKEFKREELIITSKVTKTNLKFEDVLCAAKKSLKRLQTSYIDLYLIHAPNKNIPIEETMKAMDELISQGIVKYIGVSNFSVEQLKEAQKYAKNKIVVNQIPYNLVSRNIDFKGNCSQMESEIIPYCQENDVFVMAYRPIERGILLQPHMLIDELCKKYDKTRAQIAINWVISKKNIITIPKSSDEEHLKENLGVVGWQLSDKDIKKLDETVFNEVK